MDRSRFHDDEQSCNLTLSIQGLGFSGSVTAWYGGYLLVFYLAMVALAAYTFWISLAGRPLFSEGFVG